MLSLIHNGESEVGRSAKKRQTKRKVIKVNTIIIARHERKRKEKLKPQFCHVQVRLPFIKHSYQLPPIP
jgi:hypothetical protein